MKRNKPKTCAEAATRGLLRDHLDRKSDPRPRKRVRRCQECGCTDNNCRQCIESSHDRATPCHWVDEELCSNCVDLAMERFMRMKEGAYGISFSQFAKAVMATVKPKQAEKFTSADWHMFQLNPTAYFQILRKKKFEKLALELVKQMILGTQIPF